MAQGHREVPLRLLTTAGEVVGTAHVQDKLPLVDFLNRSEHAWRLTDAKVEGSSVVHAFFAVERASVLAVIPRDSETLGHRPPAGAAAHVVTCLLARGVEVEGTLALLESVRVSDYLMRHEGFIPLRDCTLFLRLPDGTTQTEPALAGVAVQAKRIVGVAE